MKLSFLLRGLFECASSGLRARFEPASGLVRGLFGAASSRLRLRFDRASRLFAVQCVALRRPPKDSQSIAEGIPSQGRSSLLGCSNVGQSRPGYAPVMLLYV